MKNKIKKMVKVVFSLSLISITLMPLTAIFLQEGVKVQAASTSVSETFVIEESNIVELSGDDSFELFSCKIQFVSTNGVYDGGRVNYFDFKQTLTLNPNPDKTVVDFKVFYDHMYYDVSYWGSNHISTPMNWSNENQSFVLPNPWVADENTTLDTGTSLSSTNNQNGVKIFFTDQTPGITNISDLGYARKGDFTDTEGQTMDYIADVNAAFGYNIKTPSSTSVESILPIISYNSVTGVPMSKTIRLHQEKIAALNFDSGRWYGMSFTPFAYYSYQYTRTINAENPLDHLDLNEGDTASFDAPVSIVGDQDITYSTVWQVSKDNGKSYEDILGSNESTLNVTATTEDQGNFYRLKIVPNNVVSSLTEFYTEPALLTMKEVLVPEEKTEPEEKVNIVIAKQLPKTGSLALLTGVSVLGSGLLLLINFKNKKK